jgi:hypothetical protein
MTKNLIIACVAIFALASTASAQSENKKSEGQVKTESQLSYEDQLAYLNGDLSLTSLRVYEQNGLKAHHVNIGIAFGGMFADGLMPSLKALGEYETRHFVFTGFAGMGQNTVADNATIDPGKRYFALQMGGQVAGKLLYDRNHASWLGLFARANAAWVKTDDSSADYSSSGSGMELAAGIIGNLRVADQWSVRALVGAGNQCKYGHNESQWDSGNAKIRPMAEVGIIYHFNK